MRCKTCGFITKIKSDRCPYCGSEIKKNTLADVRVTVGKYYVSLKLFIPFLIFNQLWLSIGTDFLLVKIAGSNCHISPWIFLFTVIPLTFFDSFVLTGKYKKRFFTKLMMSVNSAVLIFSLSYIRDESFLNTGVKCYQFLLSYVIPVFFGIAAITNCGEFLFRKRYDFLATFFESLFMITYSAVLLGLSCADWSGIGYDLPSKIIIAINFGLSFLMLVNSSVLSVSKLATRTIQEEYNERHS